MLKIFLKEIIIYAVVLSASMFLMHPDLLSDPSVRYSVMEAKDNYTHPLIYSGVLYVVIWVFRIIAMGIKKFLKKS
ncbi:MAG: hypothetical protein GQ570_06940 [Helicobacteraceae bacterium]|nr:hypothetical protein [Helicobacteraceae bacterium]